MVEHRSSCQKITGYNSGYKLQLWLRQSAGSSQKSLNDVGCCCQLGCWWLALMHKKLRKYGLGQDINIQIWKHDIYVFFYCVQSEGCARLLTSPCYKTKSLKHLRPRKAVLLSLRLQAHVGGPEVTRLWESGK